jgi:hypothetical protein
MTPLSVTKKLFVFSIGLLLVIIGVTLFTYREDITKNGLKTMPTNNFSNSISFNAQVQRLQELDKIKKVQFLVLGSSMALNNIAAEMIEDSIKQSTYNFSSWGVKSEMLVRIMKSIEFEKCKTVIVPFSNQDLYDSVHFDVKNFDFINNYLNSSNATVYNLAGFFYNFNFNEFRQNWKIRTADLYRTNSYSSLQFDSCGSVLIDTTAFVVSKKRNDKYFDTTGFTDFMKNMVVLKSILASKDISLKLVYLPWREDLITPEREKANDAVATVLHGTFDEDFIDLHNLNLDTSLFCDASHLFKDGAKIITKHVIDSLRATH